MKKLLLLLMITGTISTSFATCFDGIKNQDNYNKVVLAPEQQLFKQNGKIQITEFFWYGCPHCFHMEPMIKEYLNKHPDVEFHRYPLAFPGWSAGTAFFFAEQDLGLTEKFHDNAFKTIHESHIDILNDKNQRNVFLKSQGVDPIKFEADLNSFSMNSKVKKASIYDDTYKLNSAPSFVVNNTYVVDPSLSKNYQGVIQTIDTIVTSLKDKSCTPQ